MLKIQLPYRPIYITCSFHLAILSPMRRMTATEPRLAEMVYATADPIAEH